MRTESGEVASWLILAAALALAASLAAGTLGDIIGSLTSNVAEAAQVESGVGPDNGGQTGPADGGPGAGSPTGPDSPTGPADGGPGAGSPTGPDGPTGPADGGPGAGSPTPADPEPEPWPDICSESIYSSCDADRNCVNFDPIACSSSPAARDAYFWYRHYETCGVAVPPIFLCSGYTRGFEAGFRSVLESELGGNPGDFFLAAAQICDAGGPSCETWTWLAQFVHDNRAVIATSVFIGDILPGPTGIGCVTAVADGSLSGGEAAECAIGIGISLVPGGVPVPIPSGAIDDAIDDAVGE